MVDDYTSWKASQARCWADMVRETVTRLEERERSLDEIRARCDGLRAVAYDRVGGSTTRTAGDDAMAAYVAQLEAMGEEWRTAYMEWRDMVCEFERALRMLDGIYDALLTARYIRGRKWEDVADLMHYDPVYVRGDLATCALAALYDVMPMQYKAPIPRAD